MKAKVKGKEEIWRFMKCLTMLCTHTAEIRKAKWNKMNEKCEKCTLNSIY